jgi:hypothetical protein
MVSIPVYPPALLLSIASAEKPGLINNPRLSGSAITQGRVLLLVMSDEVVMSNGY